MVPACDVQWGDVATWVGAGVSLLALAAAVVGAVQAFRVLGIERKRDLVYAKESAERAGEARRMQATGVCVWIGEVGTPSAHSILVVSLRNASELPVYDVVADVAIGSATASISLSVLPPAPVPLERPISLVLPPGASAQEVSLELRFRDSAGVRWRRSGSGLLDEELQRS